MSQRSESPPILPDEIFIGSVGGTGEFFDGVIDEVEFFDRALSASEIQAIFMADSAGKCKVTDGDGDGEPSIPSG